MHNNDNHQDDARWDLFFLLFGAVVSFATAVILVLTTELNKLVILLVSLACTALICVLVAAAMRKILQLRMSTKLMKEHRNN